MRCLPLFRLVALCDPLQWSRPSLSESNPLSRYCVRSAADQVDPERIHLVVLGDVGGSSKFGANPVSSHAGTSQTLNGVLLYSPSLAEVSFQSAIRNWLLCPMGPPMFNYRRRWNLAGIQHGSRSGKVPFYSDTPYSAPTNRRTKLGFGGVLCVLDGQC